MAMYLDATDARGNVCRQDLNFFTHTYPVGDKRAGDHRAEAFHGENAVNRQAENAVVGSFLKVSGNLVKAGQQPGDTGAGGGRNGNDGGAGQKSVLKVIGYIGVDQLQPVFFHQIGFGQRDHTGGDAQERTDLQMFPRLRHHALVRGDDHQDHVDACRARDHVFDKFLMPRHIDDAQRASRRQRKRGKTQLDGDTSFFFLFETICIRAGQGFNQRCLPVIDMAGCSQNKVLHFPFAFPWR